MSVPIRVLVADDHPAYRAGVLAAVREHPRLELCAAVADGPQALAEIKRQEPDVALIDLRMPKLDGFEILDALHGSTTRTVLLSAYTDGALVHEALSKGAAGYLSKRAEPSEICAAAVKVAGGATVLSPPLSEALGEYVQRLGAGKSSLSAREREALRLIASGMPAHAIGEQLHLSEATVKSYLARAYKKLGAPNRAAAIAEAMRRGMLS